MAHVSLETTYELWEHMESPSWVQLRQALNEFYYSSDTDGNGINSRTIDTLVAMTRHLEYKKNPFPSSVEQLYRVINANFGFEDEVRHGV